MGGRGGSGRSGSSSGGGSGAASGDPVRAAYAQLADQQGQWISLADIREKLSSLSRGQQDVAIESLLGHEDVRIIPVANSKSLSDRERVGGLKIGDEVSHMISVNTPWWKRK